MKKLMLSVIVVLSGMVNSDTIALVEAGCKATEVQLMEQLKQNINTVVSGMNDGSIPYELAIWSFKALMQDGQKIAQLAMDMKMIVRSMDNNMHNLNERLSESK